MEPGHTQRFSVPRRLILAVVMVALWRGAGHQGAQAAIIQAGNVTSALGPTFCVDDAATGGSDTTVNQPTVASYLRNFSGLLTAGQGPARITLTGFGFATSSSAGNNDATSLAVTFTYLGADEAVGGGDDVVIGTATGTYAYSTNGEYVFAFDTPLTADLAVTGVRFRIQVAPTNAGGNGSVLFKTDSLTYETSAGPKLSVAGFVAPLRVNLAKYQPVTTDSVSGQRLASYVTDGSAGNDNRWESDNSGPHWARVDFPWPVEVGSAQVFSGENDGGALTNFKIQYLDGATWVDAPGAAVTGNTNVETNIGFTTSVTASAFRLYDSADATVRLRELALYPPVGTNGYALGTDVTLNLAQHRAATANATAAGDFALLAVDGRVNQASKWRTTLAGANSLEIDLRTSPRIGSAHLYSGSVGVAPLADFVLKYWDGSAWQPIPGGNITGNVSDVRVILFSSPVTTNKVRLEFTNPGTTSVRELCVFPANQGNAGYPAGTGVAGAPPSATGFDEYADTFHFLTNAGGGAISVSEGVPVVDAPGVALAQKEYQILLNLGTGTFRLRNRATGNCLTGARLSKAAGAPLMDAPYAALPDQDWILHPIDATSFRLVNQWSGLAADTQGGGVSPGTLLVQNPCNDGPTQRWQPVVSSRFPKKGVGGAGNATAFKANWAYNWGLSTSSILPAGASFNPMQWGDYNWSFDTSNASVWKLYPDWRTTGDPLHLLGFNEPDSFSQSGKSLDPDNPQTAQDFSWERSLAEAVAKWPRLQAMDVPLVSPAPANFNGGWLDGFYSQADNLGYRVDYTAIHNYPGPGGGSSDGLVNTLQTAYTNWNRPVWLTEFSFVDWGGNSSWSEEDLYNCLAEFLWRAEGLPWFRKYALFVFTEDANNPQPANPWTAVTPGPRSNSYDTNGALTAFGKLYAAWDGDATVRAGKKYFLHNKDTRKRLASVLGQTNPGARNIRNDSTITRWTLVATGTSGRHHIVSESDGRRLSYTSGGSVTLADAGTTGTAVEWSLTESQYGWYFVGHPATSKRLKMAYNNSTSTATYTMESSGTTSNAVQWRFVVPLPAPVWVGGIDNDWSEAGNWMPAGVPAAGDAVAFNESSQANFDTLLNQAFSLAGLSVSSPAGDVSVSGANALTLGTGGIDLSQATRNLTISAPLVLDAAQTWNVAAGRTLAVDGGLTGAFALSASGGGTVLLSASVNSSVALTVGAGATLRMGASAVLSNAPSAVDLVLAGTLDLNGTSQSVNAISGSGVIDNTAAGAGVLTVGANAAAGITLNALLRNTNGTLALVKAGSFGLTLPSANSFGGGFTNTGTGYIYPKHNSAFGTGPVVMNGSTLYATAGSYTFANALSLNGAILRVGGAASHTLTWNGAVTATGVSGISADGSTAGVTLGGPLEIGGATFTSYANGTTNSINGAISGAGGALNVTGGTLQLSGANTYAGTTTINGAGVLRLQPGGTLSNSCNVVINGASSNLNVRNTVGWVYAGTITGDGAGQINLNSGTNATLAGPVSGVAYINANNAGTDATISGAISGPASVTVQSGVDGSGLGAILRLGGANTFTGTTSVLRGSLVLAASNVLPDTTAVSVGQATLDAATFTDTAGTLDVTGAATIHLGPGAALAFADSSAVDWTGGTLNLTGTFVSGASLRFGTSAGGLAASQLAQISAASHTGFALDANGFLTATPTGSPYEAWAAQIADPGRGGRADDADSDGFTNLQEFFFGTSPVESNGSLVTTTRAGGGLALRWLQLESGAGYTLQQSETLAPGSWTTVVWPVPAPAADQIGAPAGYDFHAVTLPVGADRRFYRIEGMEN